jgi:hypothetical protein
METSNIAAYRAHAEKCSRQSDLACDTDSKLHLLDLADAWLKLADNLVVKGRRDAATQH